MTCANTGLTSSGNQREPLTNSFGSRFLYIQTNLDRRVVVRTFALTAMVSILHGGRLEKRGCVGVDPEISEQNMLNRNQHRLSTDGRMHCRFCWCWEEVGSSFAILHFDLIVALYYGARKAVKHGELGFYVHVHGIDQKTADTYCATNFLENLSPIDRQCVAKKMWWTIEYVFITVRITTSRGGETEWRARNTSTGPSEGLSSRVVLSSFLRLLASHPPSMQWWLRFCSASMKDEDRSPNPGWSVQNFLGIQRNDFLGISQTNIKRAHTAYSV